MNIEVKCPNCNKMYFVNTLNTKFRGGYIDSECSKCGVTFNGKFLSFLMRQHYNEHQNEVNRFECCRHMIDLARTMDRELNPEPSRKKK